MRLFSPQAAPTVLTPGKPYTEGWFCDQGHVCSHDGNCSATPSIPHRRDEAHSQMLYRDTRWHCGYPLHHLSERPELYTAWLLGGLEAFDLLWRSRQP